MNTNALPIFVINLPQSTQRRQRVAKQLADLGLEAEFIQAVNGGQLTPEQLATQYDERRFFRPLSKGEIGCALSHLAAYRLIVEKEIDCALILEDDIRLSQDLARALTSLPSLIDGTKPEIIMLTHLKEFSPNHSVDFLDRYRIVPVIRAGCAHGYLVTNAGAKALLREFYPVRKPADWWELAQGCITLRGVDPFLIDWDDTTADSTLAPSRDSMRKQRKKLDYFYRKIYARLCARVLWWKLRWKYGVVVRAITKRPCTHF